MSDDELLDAQLFDDELNRLQGKPPTYPIGLSDTLAGFRVHTTEPANEVLARCREVLGCVLRSRPIDWPDNRVEPWPSLERWEALLPEWFVNLCAAETPETKLDANARRIAGLPAEIRELVDQHTAPPLGAWIARFESFRDWLWWDASVISASEFQVRYVYFDYMSHTRWDLIWLLIAAGGWRLEWRDF
jgi:hypothetical protein